MKFIDAGPFPVEIALCISPKAWASEMRERGGACTAEPFPPEDAHAIRFWTVDGSPFIVVTFRPAFRQYSLAERFGMVAHEATHVWQFIEEHISEKAAGDEIEAHTIQWLSTRLLEHLQAAGWLRR